jgi:hypothetical protein
MSQILGEILFVSRVSDLSNGDFDGKMKAAVGIGSFPARRTARLGTHGILVVDPPVCTEAVGVRWSQSPKCTA